ncbi:hypothetical protein CPY51_05925 [Rhizobium tubonense]|uniref:Uncharacterized protein n=2 Tax=Rhizobium tubonense TaxID=484088 RepID=A0A2W4CST8_9HYPH|nr:hypothetical protein CPY51_05925 [Rhizobium tubonense]
MILSLMLAKFVATPSEASDWGCEVLLCAASSNPSWHAVETCHPPMEKLISEMKKPGFSWPTCPEGGAGKPGYERYADCPAGWTPTDGGNSQGQRGSGEQSRCMRRVEQCDGRQTVTPSAGGHGTGTTANGVTRDYSGRNTCLYTEYMLRPSRADPYFFDMKDDSTMQTNRLWFNLEK